MKEADALIEQVIKRSRIISDTSAQGLTNSEKTMATIASQVNAAPKLARALESLLQSVHTCVDDSFDEGTRRQLTDAVRAANQFCE